MAATPSIKIVKTGSYKGGTRTWSNRYHFTGGVPADLSHWTTFAGNIATAEKLALTEDATFIEAVAYLAGSDLPLWTISLSGNGSVSGTGGNAMPLEVCGLLRWGTAARTSKNHPIYLFSYMHDVFGAQSGPHEQLSSAVHTALGTYAAAWLSGFSDGTNTYVRAGPNGASAVSSTAETYMTHRDFPT